MDEAHIDDVFNNLYAGLQKQCDELVQQKGNKCNVILKHSIVHRTFYMSLKQRKGKIRLKIM